MDYTVYYLQLFYLYFFPLYAYASSPSCHTIYLLSASSPTCCCFCDLSASVVEPKLFVSVPAPNFTKLRLRLRLSFVSTFYHRFHIKKWIFKVFMIEYLSNSHAGFYTMWILIFIYYLSWPGAGAETSTFRLRPQVPAPCGSGSTTLLSARLCIRTLHRCSFC